MGVYKKAEYLGEITREQILVDRRYQMSKGNFYKVKDEDKLFICCPACGQGSFSGKHEITENPAGVFTTSPSYVFQCCEFHCHFVSNQFTI